MKHSYLCRPCLLVLTIVLLPLPSRAYVLIDDIYYDLYSSTHTATVTSQVTKHTWYNEREIFYSGDVVIPAYVTYNGETYTVDKIDDGAFRECGELTSITIPHTITSFGSFNNCTKLTAVYITDLAAWCGISSYESWGFLPKTPLYYAHHLYLNGHKIERLVVPDGVTKIGNYAFSWCTDLTSVNISNSVTSIGDRAFYGCPGLTSVSISNSVKSIGGSAFSGCPGLTSVTIPENVTSIGNSAFSGGPTSVTINSNGIASQKYSLSTTLSYFFGSQVEEYVFGDEVKSIGDYACYGCEKLTSVTINNSVTSIGSYAFSGCNGLSSVIIPNSVTSIDIFAFSDCSNLTDIYCYAENVPSTGDYVFRNSSIASATLHVPAGSVEAYRTTAPWSCFGTIVPIGLVINEETTSLNIATTESEKTVIYTHEFTRDWESLYLPFAIDYDAIKADFDLAEIDGVVQNDDNNDGIADIIVLSIMGFKGQMTEPNTPYLIRAKNAGEQTIVFDDVTVCPTEEATFDCSSFSTKYEFTGSYNTLNSSALAERYVVQGGELVKGANSLAPCRWYMTATARNGAPLNLPSKIHIMPVEDVITGSPSLTPDPSPRRGEIYNVSGQRLNKMQKGINIVNGKKVVVK